MKEIYQLTISEKQARVIMDALELFTRIGIGQLQEVLRHPQYQNKIFDDEKVYRESVVLLDQIKKILTGHGPNSSYGIACTEVHDDSNIAYDLLQVIRHRLAWDRNPKGGIEVYFNRPIQYSKEELAEILMISKNDNPNIFGVDLTV